MSSRWVALLSVCGVAVEVGTASADDDASSLFVPYLSTNGALGLPELGSFTSLDSGLLPTAAAAFQTHDFQVQGIFDQSNRMVAPASGATRQLGLMTLGLRVSVGANARSEGAKEVEMIDHCTRHCGVLRDECGVDPRAALVPGWMVTVGGYVDLGPTGSELGEAGEVIVSWARRGVLVFASGTARHNKGHDFDGLILEELTEVGGTAGVEARLISTPFLGDSYFALGVAARTWTYAKGDLPTYEEGNVHLVGRLGPAALSVGFSVRRHDDNEYLFLVQPAFFF